MTRAKRKVRDIVGRMKADALLTEGHEAHERGDRVKALRLYRRAAELAPDWAAPHYNIGFVHKYACRWKESLAANLEAIKRDPEHEAAIWNAGIAATALGEWATARRLWKMRGIDLPGRRGDPASDFGSIVIRINPGSDGETIWARRLDPVRARLWNIPLPESGFAFGDVVLNDGAPQGYRESNGHQVPVLNALQRLERSPLKTYAAEVAVDSEEDIQALEQLGRERDMPVEDWSGMATLCLRCSYGKPHRHRRLKPAEKPEWDPVRQIGIAATGAARARELLREWQRDGERREVREFYAARASRPRAKPGFQWWDSDKFIQDADTTAETH